MHTVIPGIVESKLKNVLQTKKVSFDTGKQDMKFERHGIDKSLFEHGFKQKN